MHILRYFLLFTVITGTVVLSGCGQKGPLYLPKASQTTTPTQQTPAPTPSAYDKTADA